MVMPVVAVAVAAAVAVYMAVRHRRGEDRLGPADPGVGATRRVYFYAVSFASLMMAGNGIVLMLHYAIEAVFGGAVIYSSQTDLAVGMSLTLVGLPLWAFHWRVVQRQSDGAAVERRSLVRKVYLYAVLGVSVGMIIASSIELVELALGLRELRGWPWGGLAVWGAVWAFHWALEQREGQPTEEALVVRRLYVYLVSLASLTIGASGLAIIAHAVLSGGYDALLREALLLPQGSGIWQASDQGAVYALVGFAAWGAHWLYIARGDPPSVVRGAYIFLFAILGGVLTSVGAAGVALFGALSWSMGAATEPAAEHFRLLPGALSALAIGAGVWGYHWSAARREAPAAGPWSARRTYDYLVAAVGLGTLAFGAGWVVDTALTAIVESGSPLLAGRPQWRESLSLGVTLLVLGGPLWGYHWTAAQRRLRREGQGERGSLERRLFIFAALGAGAAALLASASTLLFYLFRDALAGDLSMDTLESAKIAVAAIAAVAILLPYYWLVYLRDQREMRPEREPPPRKAVSVLAGDGGQGFARRLEAALGYRVSLLRWADVDAGFPELTDAEVEELLRRISGAPGQSVLLIPSGGAVRVLSYD